MPPPSATSTFSPGFKASELPSGTGLTLSGAVARWLERDDERRELVARFTELHRQLRQSRLEPALG